MGLSTQGLTTIGSLRLRVRDLSDAQNGPTTGNPQFTPYDPRYISDAMIDAWIQADQQKLYDDLCKAYEDWNLAAPYQFVTVAGQLNYPMPPDFYRLRGVDWVQAPGNPNLNASIRRFNWQERNNYGAPLMQGAFGTTVPPYKLVNGNGNAAQLQFAPSATINGGQTVQVWYTPRLSPAQEWWQYTFAGVAVDDTLSMQLPNNGVFLFTCSSGPSVGQQFQIGANDTATAASFAACFNAYVTATANGGFSLGFYQGAVAVANGTSVQIGLMGLLLQSPTTVTFQGNSSSIIAFPAQTVDHSGFPQTLIGSISNVIDGIMGYDDWLVFKSCKRVYQKQSGTTGVTEWDADIADIEKRIQEGAINHDAAEPQTITDLSGGNGLFGGYGMMGGGDFW